MCKETVLCSTDGSPHENGRTYVVESAPEDVAAPMRAWLCPRQRAHHRLLERYQLTRPLGPGWLSGLPWLRLALTECNRGRPAAQQQLQQQQQGARATRCRCRRPGPPTARPRPPQRPRSGRRGRARLTGLPREGRKVISSASYAVSVTGPLSVIRAETQTKNGQLKTGNPARVP